MSCRLLTLESRAASLVVLGALPAVAVTSLLVLRVFDGWAERIVLPAMLCLLVVGTALFAHRSITRPLRPLTNVLAALSAGEFSVETAASARGGALGELGTEINSLVRILREQRLGAIEASALLATVVEEIQVAVFAFDPDGRIRLVNRSGARLLDQPAVYLLGCSAEGVGLADLLTGPGLRIVEATLPGARGVWQLRRTTFRQRGLPHLLVVLTDLSHVVRQEESHAWQRLVRVLGHEINNSLGPIRSVANNVQDLIAREPPSPDWREDALRGLEVIERRAEALGRFTGAYAELARLPPPEFAPMDVSTWVDRVAQLETRRLVCVHRGLPAVIEGDADQLDQLLINLVRNAVDAVANDCGEVGVTWTRSPTHVEIVVNDEGPGILDEANLFVPFFTTKPRGMGIGLVLCRQIAEAHRGNLILANRRTGRGCEARLWLPRRQPTQC